MHVMTKPKKILIVEDDKNMRDVYQFFFNEKEGFEVHIVDDAVQGSKLLNIQDFDLLILDIIMEPVSGDSLAVYLRERKEGLDIPILVISVLAREALDDLEGMNDIHYMQKPIQEAEMFRMIDEIVK